MRTVAVAGFECGCCGVVGEYGGLFGMEGEGGV